MHSHDYDSIVEAQTGVRAAGYKEEFLWKDGEMLSEDSSVQYDPEDFTVVEHYRFEGDSNPDDTSILLVIEARDGRKGYVVNGYGNSANTSLGEFLEKVPTREDTDVHKRL